jgi:hypothetical protein
VSRAVAEPPRSTGDLAWLIAATAGNLAGWHDLSIRSLGMRSIWDAGWWVTPDDVPGIYFRAIAVRPGADPLLPTRVVHRARWIALCDPWSDLDLRPTGLAVEADRPWMVRDPGSSSVSDEPPGATIDEPAGLTIERLTDPARLAEFEATSAAGFEQPAPAPPGWQGPAVVADPRASFHLGSVAGRPVSTANGFLEAGVLGIYGVATVPAARGLGFATALTIRTLARHPSATAVLQPSEHAERLYVRLGFERFTTFRTWTRSDR